MTIRMFIYCLVVVASSTATGFCVWAQTNSQAQTIGGVLIAASILAFVGILGHLST